MILNSHSDEQTSFSWYQTKVSGNTAETVGNTVTLGILNQIIVGNPEKRKNFEKIGNRSNFQIIR